MVSSKVVGAGAFVIIGVLLFTAALFMIGERRMLFEDRFELYTEFAKLGQLEVGRDRAGRRDERRRSDRDPGAEFTRRESSA